MQIFHLKSLAQEKRPVCQNAARAVQAVPEPCRFLPRRALAVAPQAAHCQPPADSAFGTKYVGLLDNFTAIVSGNSNVAPSAFVQGATAALQSGGKVSAPLRDSVVREYVRRLEEALGDDGFVEIHRQLADDSSVTPAEMVAIAKAFAD